MPYIKKEDRGNYNTYIRELANALNRLDKNALSGHLNYIITKLIVMTQPKRYNDYNRLIGVIECVKQELYRRKIVPYEDLKIEENSDVY